MPFIPNITGPSSGDNIWPNDNPDLVKPTGRNKPFVPAPQADPRNHWRLVPSDSLNRSQRPTQSELNGEIAGYRSSIAIPYGTVRLPGKITGIYHQSGNYYFVFAICLGTVTDISKAFWNGVEITTSATANGQYAGTMPEAGELNLYDGSQDYIDDKLLLVNIASSTGDQYTATHQGYCYAMVQIPDTLVDGMPRFEVLLDGLAVPGAGGSGSAFSQNPARICADLLSNTTYGASQTMDWTTVDTAADYCDEQVGGENRSEFAMALQRPRPIPEWVGVISAYGSFYVDATGSTVKFIVDNPRDAVAHFGPGKIIEGSTSWVKDMGTRHPDDIEVEWQDASTGDTKIASAIGELSSPLVDFIRMPGFTSHSQAKRFAIQRLNQIRLRDLSYTLDVSNEGMEITIGDRVDITDDRWRVVNKPFICVGVTIPSEGIYRLSLIEYQPNAYSDAVETEPVIDDSSLPSPFTYPSTLTFTSNTASFEYSTTGDVQHYADITWVPPADYPYITGYHVIAGWAGSAGLDAQTLLEVVLPPDTTTVRVPGNDPDFINIYSPVDVYVTILTAFRPNRQIIFDVDSELAGGPSVAASGIYWLGFGGADDPTPTAVTDVDANQLANQVAGIAGVLVSWRYDRRPNYVRRFKIEIYNVTQASIEVTVYSSGRNVLVTPSGWNSASDTYRADVYAENRSADLSTVASSSNFTVTSVA